MHNQERKNERGRVAGMPSAALISIGLALVAVSYVLYSKVSLSSLVRGALSSASTAGGSGSEVCCSGLTLGKHRSLYVRVKANVRSMATTIGNTPTRQLERSTFVDGTIVLGADGITRWLKLADGSGYVSANVVSTGRAPVLAQLIDEDRIAKNDLLIKEMPLENSTVRLILRKDSKYFLVGHTENGFDEISVRGTSVQFGYVDASSN
jgi:hypothetical protein